jgi:hypothetical protein
MKCSKDVGNSSELVFEDHPLSLLINKDSNTLMDRGQ